MIPFENVKVLIEGKHDPINGKIIIGSTVTLIKGEKNVLVDTGGFANTDRIITELEKEGLKPEEIDIVFLTHLHIDHSGNANLFRNARILMKFTCSPYPGQIQRPKEGTLERTELVNGTEIIKDVKVIELPGHSIDLIGLIIESNKGKVVIASDAISSEDWVNLDKKPMPFFYNAEEFEKSRKKVLEIADYIIPGHGKMFKVQKQ
ncbi:MAG: MBL fold metallo-hydrolase [archaeon]